MDVVQVREVQRWRISFKKQQMSLAQKMIRDRSYDQRLKKGKTMDKNETKKEDYLPDDNKDEVVHCMINVKLFLCL